MKNVQKARQSRCGEWSVTLNDWGVDDRWEGTAMIYTARGRESFALSGDYDVTYQTDCQPEELRAAKLKSPRKELAKNDQKLQDQLVVLFGPGMSARSAVRTLRALANRIKDEGLNIGRVDNDGDFEYESVDVRERSLNKREF